MFLFINLSLFFFLLTEISGRESMSSLDVPSLLINLYILFEPYSPDKIKLVETLKCMQARICMHLVGNVCLEKRIVGITKVNGLRTIEKHKKLGQCNFK